VYPQSYRALALLLRFADIRDLAAQASADRQFVLVIA
jgi:hypothetical protein